MAVTVTNQPKGSNMKNETFSARQIRRDQVLFCFRPFFLSLYYIHRLFRLGNSFRAYTRFCFCPFLPFSQQHFIRLIYCSCILTTAPAHFSKWEKFWVKNYCPSGGGPASRISVTAVIDIYSSLNHFFPPSYIYHNVRWCHHRSLHFLFFADVFMNILIFQYCPLLLFHFS